MTTKETHEFMLKISLEQIEKYKQWHGEWAQAQAQTYSKLVDILQNELEDSQ